MNYQEKLAKAKESELKKYLKRAIRNLVVYSIIGTTSVIVLLLFCHRENRSYYIALVAMLYLAMLVFEFMRYQLDRKNVEINLWGKV